MSAAGRSPSEELAERVAAARRHAAEASEEARRLRLLVKKLRDATHGPEMLVRCAWCGRIRAGDQWFAVGPDLHVQLTPGNIDRSSHGICPECLAELAPDLAH
jgi:cytochrome c2